MREDVPVRIIHAGDGTLWTDLENATTGELGGAAVLKKGPSGFSVGSPNILWCSPCDPVD
ncbi:MAG: hypothetical protein FJ225_01065 [Lentisphaerae bacterium]|nr:hypothetical protein [Lentisphaerota bacterium]